MALFCAMIAYMVYFQTTKAHDVVSNSQNKHQDVYQKKVVRGSILSSDGKKLAYTKVSKDGKEQRVYPYKNEFAHVVGIDSHGKYGLELSNNYELMNSSSGVVNQMVNEIQDEKSPGDNIVTTLDIRLQKAAYQGLGDYEGAVVAMEADTGKILAMVSKPDYNPNEIAKNWEKISTGTDAVLVNRATQGKYTPGSVFKIFTTLAFIRQDKNFDQFYYKCTGSVTFNTKDQYTIKCFDGEYHGGENLENAFANSCNGAFATIGSELDKTKFQKFTDQMLFNTDLPISIAASKSSIQINKKSSLFDMTQTCIGQGTTMLTPLHMTLIASAVANDGVLMKPYLVTKVTTAEGKKVKNYNPTKYKDLMTREEAQVLQTYMQAVVNYGTATGLKTSLYQAAGKTGTAEIDKNDHINSWFVGYIEKDGKKIAISVVLENILADTGTASNIVRNIFDQYYTNQ